MLNVESDDYGELEARDCGCLMGRLGYRLHLHSIRSWEKLTSEGMNFIRADLVQLVEEVLPHRFGGAATNWQLAEDELDGLPRVAVIASPRLGPLDDAKVVAAVIDHLDTAPGGSGDYGQRWREAGTLHVTRREPYATGASKIFALWAFSQLPPACRHYPAAIAEGRAMRYADRLVGALVLSAVGASAALAFEARDGVFVAENACVATVRIRDRVGEALEPGASYRLLGVNRTDATHYQIRLPDGGGDRWVPVACGRTQAAGGGTVEPGTGREYVLAVSWQPAFCEGHADKPECASQTEARFDASNLTLHGLWPQPRSARLLRRRLRRAGSRSPGHLASAARGRPRRGHPRGSRRSDARHAVGP